MWLSLWTGMTKFSTYVAEFVDWCGKTFGLVWLNLPEQTLLWLLFGYCMSYNFLKSFWFENWHDFCHFLNFVVLRSGDPDRRQKNSLHMWCSTLSSHVMFHTVFTTHRNSNFIVLLLHQFMLKSSSSSIGTTAHCGLWPVEQCPSIFSYLPPSLSLVSLSALENFFLLPLSILSWVFPFVSSFPVLEWRSFWASYPPFSPGDLTNLSCPPPFSPGDLTNLSFAFYPFYYIFSFACLF